MNIGAGEDKKKTCHEVKYFCTRDLGALAYKYYFF